MYCFIFVDALCLTLLDVAHASWRKAAIDHVQALYLPLCQMFPVFSYHILWFIIYNLNMSCIIYFSMHKVLFLLAPTEKTFSQNRFHLPFCCRSRGKFFRAAGQRTLGCCGICRALLLVLEVQRSFCYLNVELRLSHFRCWYRFWDVTSVQMYTWCLCLFWPDVIFADNLRTRSSDLLSTCIV